MKRLAVLISGGGSNLQAIIDSTKNGILKGVAEVVVVISSNPFAYGLERAKKENIKAVALDYKNIAKTDYNNQLYELMKKCNADLICLAGYLKKIPDNIIKEYKLKILNIHPALLPKFGGKGMYGQYVHEAVVKAKEKKSGPTVHFVDENYDTGSIILQKEVPVYETDTPDDVAKRVLVQEHIIYSQAIKKVLEKYDNNM